MKYRLSFTTGGMLVPVCLRIAAAYLVGRNWDAAYDSCVAENWLQSRTVNTSRRIARELVARLGELSDPELEALTTAPTEGIRIILWLAICRHYRLVADFATEVVRERYLAGEEAPLKLADFDSFYERKATTHPELAAVSPATRGKLRQKAFQFLQEAGLLDEHRAVKAVDASSALLSRIPAEELSWLTVYVKGGAR